MKDDDEFDRIYARSTWFISAVATVVYSIYIGNLVFAFPAILFAVIGFCIPKSK